MRRVIRLPAACVLVLGLLAVGCASRTKTMRTEKQVQYPAEATQRSSPTVVMERETTNVTTTTTAPREAPGVFSTVVHLVGEVLALPFRLIGGLVRLLF